MTETAAAGQPGRLLRATALCAELLPELVTPGRMGLSAARRAAGVPAGLSRQARRAVSDCPALALMISDLEQH